MYGQPQKKWPFREVVEGSIYGFKKVTSATRLTEKLEKTKQKTHPHMLCLYRKKAKQVAFEQNKATQEESKQATDTKVCIPFLKGIRKMYKINQVCVRPTCTISKCVLHLLVTVPSRGAMSVSYCKQQVYMGSDHSV